jgi:glycosyltransferase involved in cell wall biosynthesis
VDDCCRWLGFLDGRAKWEATATAHWFVLPSASENFGIAAIEALAAGTPPILSPEVAIAAQIEAAGAGWLVPGQVESLADRLTSALAGPPAPMRAAARRLAAESFGWPSIAATLASAYAGCLAGGA